MATPRAKKRTSEKTTAARTRGGGVLGQNSYGKSRVRMVKVSRVGKWHTVREVCVDIALEGDFEAIHTRGDNRLCLPTDTMKNTVYAMGKNHSLETVESFAADLARHFASTCAPVSRARVRVSEVAWERAMVRGREHAHCFLKGSEERAACEAVADKRGVAVTGEIEGLVILKSTGSAFSGYMKDKYTTLQETRDRIMATSVTARWEFGESRDGRINFGSARERIRAALIGTFARHKSESVQQTLYAMGEAALRACREIERIRISMPNKHCLLVNLSPFGLKNHNEVFVPTEEPHGLIEAVINREKRVKTDK